MTVASATPQWLVQPEVGLCPCGCIGKRRKGSFVEKTLSGASALLRQAMFSEDVASEAGLLQRIDPRVKIASLFGLLVVTAFVRNVPVLVGVYLLTLGLAAASKLSLSFFVKRVWLFIPIFTGLVVLPATLNVITPGRIVVPLGTWFGYQLGLTAQGLTSAALIVTRVAASISLVVLLTLTTPWAKLLAALRAFRVPRMFILVLGMAYRYLYHLLGSVTDMYTARKARTVGLDNDVTSSRAFVAASAGALFGKSHALSEEVHMAMLARSYTGEARSVTVFKVRAYDLFFAVACAAAVVIILELIVSSVVDLTPVGTDTLLALHHVSYAYLERFTVLDDVTLVVGRGEKVALLGANGCGKSTLLKVLDGLVFPDVGQYEAFGAEVTEDNLEDAQFSRGFRSRIGFVFQNSDAQVFSPTVREEIAFGPLNMGMARDEVAARVDDTLAMLDIADLAERAPYQLSGGQKKRVAIGSVLVMNPDVLLFDEPTAALDPRTQQWLIDLIVELNAAGKTIVLATHDLERLDVLADRCVVFSEAHRIVAEGPPGRVLADRDLLLSVNLVHEHSHAHGALVHSHVHGPEHHDEHDDH